VVRFFSQGQGLKGVEEECFRSNNTLLQSIMMCLVWPWELWVFVVVTIPLFVGLLTMHVVHALRRNCLAMKLFELALCSFFYLAPVLPSAYFHFHHWFAGWFIGMHCNFDGKYAEFGQSILSFT
jgi:hypothetical protein